MVSPFFYRRKTSFGSFASYKWRPARLGNQYIYVQIRALWMYTYLCIQQQFLPFIQAEGELWLLCQLQMATCAAWEPIYIYIQIRIRALCMYTNLCIQKQFRPFLQAEGELWLLRQLQTATCAAWEPLYIYTYRYVHVLYGCTPIYVYNNNSFLLYRRKASFCSFASYKWRPVRLGSRYIYIHIDTYTCIQAEGQLWLLRQLQMATCAAWEPLYIYCIHV